MVFRFFHHTFCTCYCTYKWIEFSTFFFQFLHQLTFSFSFSLPLSLQTFPTITLYYGKKWKIFSFHTSWEKVLFYLREIIKFKNCAMRFSFLFQWKYKFYKKFSLLSSPYSSPSKMQNPFGFVSYLLKTN